MTWIKQPVDGLGEEITTSMEEGDALIQAVIQQSNSKYLTSLPFLTYI